MPIELTDRLDASRLDDFSPNGMREQAQAFQTRRKLRMEEIALRMQDINSQDANPPTPEQIKESAALDAEYAVIEKDYERIERALDATLAFSPIDIDGEIARTNWLALCGGKDLVDRARADGRLMDPDAMAKMGYSAPIVLGYPGGTQAIVMGTPTDAMIAQIPGNYQDQIKAAVDKQSTSAGVSLPERTATRALDRMKKYSGVSGWVSEITTGDGNKVGYPAVDDIGNEGSWVAEGYSSIAAAADLTIAEKELMAHVLTSGPMRVSKTALRDVMWNLMGVVERNLLARMSRSMFKAVTTGNGMGRPSGLVNGGKVYMAEANATPSLATDITMDSIFDFVDSVDDGYLELGEGMHEMAPAEAGMVGFMLAKGMRTLIRKMEDKEGRLLWQPSLTTGEPAMLAGYPWTTNHQLPTPAASAKGSMLFGAFSYYVLRMVEAVIMLIYNDSKYAELNSIGVQTFSECDGGYVGGFAGTNTSISEAVSVYQQPAS